MTDNRKNLRVSSFQAKNNATNLWSLLGNF